MYKQGELITDSHPDHGRPASTWGVTDIRAVVVSYNSLDDLPGCLDSLMAEGVQEIIVVENGDLSATKAAMASFSDSVVWRGRGNLGYGAGVNLGFADCTKPVALFLNPDVILSEGSIHRMMETLIAEDAAAVGPLIIDSGTKVVESARTFPSTSDAAGHALLGKVWPHNPWTQRYHGQARLLATEPSDVDWLQGSCLLMQSSDFVAVNGFDEAYFMYVEDTDLCWRLGQRGRRVVFEPRAMVRHLGGSSTKKRPTTMALAHHRSALRFWWRSRTGRQRLAAPLAVLLLGVRLVAVLGMKWVTRLLPASLQRRETDAHG